MNNHPTPPIFETLQYKDSKFSLFKTFADKHPETIDIEQLIRMLKSEQCKDSIEKLRLCSDPAEKDRLKKGLPAVSVSGVFKDGRRAENIQTYSALIQMDFDKLNNPESFKTELSKDPYTHLAFISPSGTGLKLIVKVSINRVDHLENFKNLSVYFLNKYGELPDKACKDVSRLMFLSYDPDLYFNQESLIWSNETALNSKFENVLNYIIRYSKFEKGNRNKFIFDLSLECSAQNLKFEFVTSECLKRFQSEDFQKIEIQNSVESAYKYPAGYSAQTDPPIPRQTDPPKLSA